MFDDITDEEYAEWKDWFDAGNHNFLACIVLIVIGLFVGAAVLEEVKSDDMAVKSAAWKSGTTTDVFHDGPCDILSNFDDGFDDTLASPGAEDFDRQKAK